MKRDMPKISVIMPVYNEERYVQEAIESILSQTYTDFELIIIDDASNDKSREIISSFTDERIIYIRNERNLGCFPSRNLGMRVAKGCYIAVLDADDVAFPERLERQVTYLDEHTEYIAVGAWFLFYNIQSAGKPNAHIRQTFPVEYEDVLMSLLIDTCLIHSSLMVRAEYMRETGGYDEQYLYASDYALLCRIALAGKLINLPEVLVKYRWHSAQISQFHRKEQLVFVNEIRYNYQLAIINRFGGELKLNVDKYILGNPVVGRIIALYVYALHSGSLNYKMSADLLLDDFFQEVKNGMEKSINQALCYIGCGLIFLLRNGFVEGNEDELLEEVDSFVTDLVRTGSPKIKEELSGWIHYLLLRIENSGKRDELRYLNNWQSLISLLDYLDRSCMYDENIYADVQNIHTKKLYPIKTESLLYDGWPKESVIIVIPVRIDCCEREANLDFVLDILTKDDNIRIFLLEADEEKHYRVKKSYQNVEYRFIEDKHPVFHKTHYVNVLLKQVDAEWVGVWDMDVIVPTSQIYETILSMKKNDAVIGYPHDGRLYSLSEKGTMLYKHNSKIRNKNFCKNFSIVTDSFVGGVYIVNKKKYLQVGGENENLYGCGYEDLERIKRMEILNHPIYHAAGSLFRLYYPQSKNLCFGRMEYEIHNKQEFIMVCAMTHDELLQYIRTWNNCL